MRSEKICILAHFTPQKMVHHKDEFEMTNYPLDTGCKLNVHKTSYVRSIYVMCPGGMQCELSGEDFSDFL